MPSDIIFNSMKTVRNFFLILLVQASAFLSLSAQQDRIRQLESEIDKASGFSKVEHLIQITDLYLAEGDYKNAARRAEEAELLAKKINAPELRAEALSREGIAMISTGKRGLFGKDLAEGRFEKSNEILRATGGDKKLMLVNLNYLKALAERSNDTQKLEEITVQMQRLSGVTAAPNPGTTAAAPPPVPAPPGQSNNSAAQKALQDLLAAKEAEIDAMTQTQMKTEILLMQQRTLVDSMRFKSNLDSLSAANAQLALREAETSRNLYFAIITGLLVLAAGSMYSFIRAKQNARILAEKNQIIREEQQRSENLLLNILPSLVAQELKSQGHTTARYFEDVSVLFADFVGFSKIAERLSPQQLVTELDTCFRAFDTIIARYQLEKIKTIGDAYMCAGGLQTQEGAQSMSMVQAAREMQQWLAAWNHEREKEGLPRYDARIGIHRGPVVAGVVGSKKFAFDIWGDTVNIAARVEQAGESGKINISGDAFQAVKDHFSCAYRGKIAVKNKGEIDMYFVEN
jgi:adenylate cyclase